MQEGDKSLESINLGRTPEALAETLRSSKLTSTLFDPPLKPSQEAPQKAARQPLPRYWLCRLYLSASLLLKAITLFLVPESITGQALASTSTGTGLLGIIAALGLAGMFDCILNDHLRRGWRFRFTWEHRHWIYNTQALAILALVYTLVKEIGWSPILLSFVSELLVALLVAPLDMLSRHREGTFK